MSKCGGQALIKILMYRIVGFVCEVLICANYARCYKLTEINSMHINCTHMHSL